MRKLIVMVLILILATTLPLTAMAQQSDQTPQRNLDALKQQKQLEAEYKYINIGLLIEEPEGFWWGWSVGTAGAQMENQGRLTGKTSMTSVVEHLAYSEETDYNYTTNDAARLISNQATIEIKNDGNVEIDSIECFQITNLNTDRYNTSTKAVPCTFIKTEDGYQIKSSNLEMWKNFDVDKGNSNYVGILIIRVTYDGNSMGEYGMIFKPGNATEIWERDDSIEQGGMASDDTIMP